MCDWAPAELLNGWRARAGGELERLGLASRLRSLEGGDVVVVDLRGARGLASVTAWSTGLLELTTRATRAAANVDQPDDLDEPAIVTEQRHGLEPATRLLDAWTDELRHFATRA
jgi:nitrogen fixation protein